MPRFTFEAIDRGGARVRGTLDAQTRSVALDQLLASGQTPVSLRADAQAPSGLAQLSRLLRFRAFDYQLFLRELGMLLKAGLPLERALSVLQGLAPNGGQALRLQQLLDKIRGGESLSQAFAGVISEAPRYVSRLIAAGEASGKLAEVVARLAAGLARTKALRDKLISNLTYPIVLALTMTTVLYVVFTSVLPRLTPMFKAAGASLPAATRMLLGLGNFFQSYGLILVLLIAAAIAAFLYAWRRPAHRLVIDRFLMRSKMLLGLPNGYESARFCRNLQTLLDGGLPLERALGAAHDGVVNSWFRARMAEARTAVGEGEPLRSAFAKSTALPAIVVEFAAVGEETGRLGPMIGEVAEILDHDVEKKLDRLTALVLPIATLVMGGLVAMIMAGIITGVLAVNDLAR